MVHGGGGARVSMGILNELNGLNTEKRKKIIKMSNTEKVVISLAKYKIHLQINRKGTTTLEIWTNDMKWQFIKKKQAYKENA